MKIVAIILAVSIVIAVFSGSMMAFDFEAMLNGLDKVNILWVNVTEVIGNIWVHDYYDPDSGIDWVDSILGSPFIDVIVNTCYRLIDTAKLLGTFVISSNLLLETLTPWKYVKPIDNMYLWTEDQYIWGGSGYDGIETFEPTDPAHRGGR